MRNLPMTAGHFGGVGSLSLPVMPQFSKFILSVDEIQNQIDQH
jgi:hypothetical protein